jgi:hypothetical protein
MRGIRRREAHGRHDIVYLVAGIAWARAKNGTMAVSTRKANATSSTVGMKRVSRIRNGVVFFMAKLFLSQGTIPCPEIERPGFSFLRSTIVAMISLNRKRKSFILRIREGRGFTYSGASADCRLKKLRVVRAGLAFVEC